MDNPAIQDDFPDDEDDDDRRPVAFFNRMKHNVDLAFVYETEEGERVDVIEENISSSEERSLYSYEGHVFRALLHGTATPVCEFMITEEQDIYTIEQKEAPEDHQSE